MFTQHNINYMRIIPLVYPSAAHFWLQYNLESYRYNINNRVLISLPYDYHINHAKDSTEQLVQRFNLPEPLTILSSNKNRRYKRTALNYAIKSDLIPDKSFIRIHDLSDGTPVYIACPEYCFLSAANYMSLLELIMFGYSLCAVYVPDSNEMYLQRSRNPITDSFSILSFLENCKGARGVKKAKRAIKYVLNNSNSPMETKFAMAATLPFSLGGFAITKPELNVAADLSPQGRDYLGSDCFCDMQWKKLRIAAEYDSNMTHLNPKQHAKDKRRTTALSMSGYKIFSTTSDYMSNFAAFEQTFMSLRAALGMSKETARLAKYIDVRYDLFHFLLKQNKGLI